jgi:hypothetical protein
MNIDVAFSSFPSVSYLPESYMLLQCHMLCPFILAVCLHLDHSTVPSIHL